eukprot:4526095-Prymnesium_polylepis.1
MVEVSILTEVHSLPPGTRRWVRGGGYRLSTPYKPASGLWRWVPTRRWAVEVWYPRMHRTSPRPPEPSPSARGELVSAAR